MLLAMSAVGIAAVLGFALISSAMLQNHTGRNARNAISADALAESGIDLACLYLVSPEKAPPFVGDFWPGKSGISFGASMPGTVDVTVVNTAKNTYTITAVATTGGTRRTATASVKINPGFRVKYGATFNDNAITIPTNSVINSSVQVKGTLTNKGSITGNARSASFINLGLLNGVWSLLDLVNDPIVVPAADRVNKYTTYVYNGQTYSAKSITATTLAPGTTLGPTVDNPAGVFCASHTLTLSNNVTINGTLIADAITISGANNVITPMPGFPAAEVKGTLDLRHSKFFVADITFNGILWTNGTVKSTLETIGLYSPGSMNINGAWLMAGGSLDPNFRGKINITHNKNNTAGVNLDISVPPPGVFIQSFK